MSSSTSNANFYADFKSLSALKLDAKTDQQKALRAAAQEFESLFTNMMLKSMRSATAGIGGTDNSSEMDLYQSMFDQQISSQLSKGKGMGLADMLVQQLTRSGLVQGSQAASQSSTATATGNEATSTATGTNATSSTSTGVTNGSGNSEATTSIAALTGVESTSPASFVQSLWPQAQAAAKQLGIDPAMLVAHAALETGWGKHVPCNADGSSSFNLFGIKAGSHWSGQSVGAQTTEFSQGLAVSSVERFKSYGSVQECLSDYASLLSRSSRFSAVGNSGSDASRFAQTLQSGGYATDPNYATKLRTVAGSVISLLNTPAAPAAFTRTDT